MVSYPADDARSMSHASSSRRTASVVGSSASTVRRHHHARGSRSHAGTPSSRGPSNEFPNFTHTGDVEIVIAPNPRARRRRDSGTARGEAPEQRYLLHRLILAQCSAFFEEDTSEEWARQQAHTQAGAHGPYAGYSRQGQEPPKKRWRYELDWGRGEDDVPMLVQRDVSASSFGGDSDGRYGRPPPTRPKPQPPPSGFFRSMANFSSLSISSHSRSNSTSDPLDPNHLTLQAYDNLFRIFYNYSPTLDPVKIAQAYVECKALLQVADMYDALEIAGPRVDHHLLRFGSQLWRQIAKYPPSYLKLGYLARSKAIFGEAFVHVVGNWPACAQQLGYAGPLAPRSPSDVPRAGAAQLPEVVFELLEDKVDELEDLKARVEAKLWRLTLTTSRGERVSPANSWTDWLAMSLFRQWLAENTTPPPASILKDSSTGRTGSRGSTTASSSSHNHRSSSSSRHPPVAYNGSSLSATAALDPRAQARQPSRPPPFNTGRVFRLIGIGGQSYLPHHELKAFLKLHPENYDRDKLRRFERRMDDLKNIARDAVKPLMRNFLSVDVTNPDSDRDGSSVSYLTCVRVGENEFPWEG